MINPISIIIPTRDRLDVFLYSLKFLINEIKHINYELIIVNDSPNPFDSNVLSFIESTSNVNIINTGGKGVAYARNVGVKNSTYELILFIDDDILVTKEQILYLYNYQNKNQNHILMLNWEYTSEINNKICLTKFGRYIIANQLNSFRGYRKHLHWVDNEIFEVEAFANFLIMIRKSLFLQVGGYNETFPFAGGEDTELSKRLSVIGIKFFIDPNKKVFHNEIDRTEVDGWLLRKKRSGMTLRAMEKILTQKKNTYSKKKIVIIKTMIFIYPLIKFVSFIIPNHTIFDKLYFSIINVMVACSIYKGYTYND